MPGESHPSSCKGWLSHQIRSLEEEREDHEGKHIAQSEDAFTRLVFNSDFFIQELADAEIEIYQFPDCDSDEDDDFKEQNEKLKHSLPFALVGISQIL